LTAPRELHPPMPPCLLMLPVLQLHLLLLPLLLLG
jgi:hypothetical protein